MADRSRSPDDDEAASGAARAEPHPVSESKRKVPSPPKVPPPAGRFPPAGKLPPVREARGGVITGVSKSSRPPPPPPTSSKLPTLAPPQRRGVDKPASEPPSAGQVAGDAIDIELDVLLADDAGPKVKPSSRPPPSERLPAICMYGRYEVLGRIAFGGMAEIFLGRETTSVGASRYLVIKRILSHVADDEQFVDMFLDEARLAIQLNHPNICHIYEFGELEQSYFIAMEWVNGVPLGKLIRKARLIGGVPPELGARIIGTIAEALHYAHRAKDALGRPMGIVHRDVSPHNVMVAYDGQVKLLDFGIAKASTHATKTEAGVVKGKFSYMAPEQCLGKPVDARSDVFAIGICLYETLTGKALYNRENEYETMRAVIHDPPPSILEHNADLPKELDAIVQKALMKEAAARYQSAGEMQSALEKWLASTGKVVNASKIAELMDELYEQEIKRGPLVDSTPFGQSFQRMKPVPGRQTMDDSQPAVSGVDQASSGVSQPTGSEMVMPARRSAWTLLAVAAALLVVGLGAGYLLFYRPRVEQAPPIASDTREEEPPPEEEPTETAVVEPPAAEPEVPEAPAEPEVPAVGSAQVTSTPGRATVRVDGEQVDGVTPLTLADLSPGTHHVVVERAGYRDWEGDVEIAAGEEATVTATLSPVPREPAAPPGRLSINTRPWSKVYVGRRLLGTTPIAEAQVPSGAVRMRLVDRDGVTHTKTVRVQAGQTERVFFDLGQ